MASLPFPGQWPPEVNLTGNSGFVVDPDNGTVWLVGEALAAGPATLYRSTNAGITFSALLTITGTYSPAVAFDPALALDGTGENLYFLGQVSQPDGTIQVGLYGYNVAGNQITGPFLLTQDGLVGADYDLVWLQNGNLYCVVCLITEEEETLFGFEMAPDGTQVSQDLLIDEQFSIGNRYGAVSLYSPDGVAVEIYVNQHPKVVSFKNFTVTVSLILRSAGDSLQTRDLTTFSARHIDNRLTVIGQGTARYLTLAYYAQAKANLIGNVLLGIAASGVWIFSIVPGAPGASVVEPTLSLSPTGLILGVLTKTVVTQAVDGPILLRTLDPNTFLLTPRIDFPYGTSASFLRGTKSYLPTTMPWGMLAQQVSGQAIFYTGFNAPVSIVLSPVSIPAAVRGVTYQFNASGSSSPNLDRLLFTWSVTDPTGQALFIVDGVNSPLATLTLPLAAGPDPQTLTVTVSIVATDANGVVLHTAQSDSATITYPSVPPPVIVPQSPLPVARNTEITFTPTIQYAGGALFYTWFQSSGTPVTMVSLSNGETLRFWTQGALVQGEDLVFTFSVTDNINQPVTQDFTFSVEARAPVVTDSGVLNRFTWPGTLSARNTLLVWSDPVVVNPYPLTSFTTARRAALLHGGYVYLLISPYSVVVEQAVPIPNTLTVVSALYSVFLPDVTATIFDAVHSDLNQTIVLTSSGLLQQFLPSAAGATDDAVATLDVAALGEGTYQALQATPSYGGVRIFTLSGTMGILMLEVTIANFQIVGVLQLNQSSGLLYGGDQVTYCRTAGVESLRTGKVLVGTVDAAGAPYETVIDLRTRSIIDTFDSTNLQSTRVTTGEELFTPPDSYAGEPLAPVLAVPTVSAAGVTLAWSQSRPDLVTSYQILYSFDGGIFTLLTIVAPGLTQKATIPGLPTGVTYGFQVMALSNDGPSLSSNVEQLTL